MTCMNLGDRLALHELPGRYGDIFDDRDWDRLGTVFVDDAAFDLTDLEGPHLEGLEAIREFVANDVEHLRTHTMTNVYVDETPEGAVLHFRLLALIGGGRVGTTSFRGLVVSTTDGWRLRHLTVKRRRGVS